MKDNLEKNLIQYRNCDIKSVTMGIPAGHRHLRAAVETEDNIFVFQEATLAGLVRAYINIKTDPYRKAVCLVGQEVQEQKSGYARYQLMEIETAPERLEEILGGK